MIPFLLPGKAFYLDSKYTNPNKGIYSEGIQAYVADNDRVVILHADDVGMCEEANVSAKRYLKNDFIQSAAAMPPCPNFEESIEWAKANPQEDVGLHLTLTSEWKTYRWGPVADPADVPGLVAPEGKLWPTVRQVVEHATPQEVEQEIRAQVEKSLALGYRPDHIDTHMGTLYGTPAFAAVYTKVAEEYGIPAMVIDVSNPAVVQKLRKQGYPTGEEMLEVLKDEDIIFTNWKEIMKRFNEGVVRQK